MLARTIAYSVLVAVPVCLAAGWYVGHRAHHEAPEVRSYATRVEDGRGSEDEEGPSTYPSDWAWLRRTMPYGRADGAAFLAEVERARSMRKAAGLGRRTMLSPVTPAGPDNIGGRFSDVEWDPVDPDVVYAGAATGGVFKSVNGGLTWTPIGDPSHPQTVWLGTGEPNGGHNNFPGDGVYRSDDGGATWSFMGLEKSASIGRIVVDPTDGDRVFVAAQGSYFGPNPERGLYRTTDGGASWDLVLSVTDSTGATDVVMDPTDPSRLLVAMWERVRPPNGGTHLFGATSRIWRSLDGGDTWTPLGVPEGLPEPTAQSVGRIGLSLCAEDPDVVYALITDGNLPIGLWRSLDFGATWVNRDVDGEIRGGAGGFSWYFGQVRVAPDDCDRVFALDVTFFRSDDGGITFPIKYGATGSPAGFHVDHHALAFSPASSAALIEGNDGGLNSSVNSGTSWTKIFGLPTTQFYEIGLDPQNPGRLYGGSQDNGTLRTTGGVSTWTQILGADGFYVNVDPTDADVIYAETQNGSLRRSNNGGGSWSVITPGGASGDRRNWSTPAKLDPSNPNVLYYGTHRVWRSENGGGSWTAVSGDLTGWVPGAALGTITTIGVSPAADSVVWAGTDDGRIWRGEESGGLWTWTNVTTTNLPPRWITRVVPHPTDPLAAWITFTGLKWKDPESHVFATTDGGASWTDIAGNLPEVPVNAMAVDPLAPERLFVGTDLGAYYSLDGGGSWEYLSPDLPLVTVYDMAIHPTARYLAIGTYGRSMYTMDIDQVLAAGSPPRPAAGTLLQNRPNPFTARTSIGFTLARAGAVRLEVFDVGGRRVRTIADGSYDAGRHDVAWDGRDDAGRAVAAGNYRCRLSLPDGAALTRGMVVVK